jgi:hypothetical protein
MISASMYALLLCFLIFNNEVFGFAIHRTLREAASNSLANEQREIDGKRQFITNTNLAKPDYTKDSFNVYFAGQKVDGASASTFKSLGDGYGKDSWNVYYMGKKVAAASTGTFVALGGGYGKDSWNVYFGGQQVSGASSSTFISLGNGYGKDNWNFYHLGKKTQSAPTR